MILADSYNHDKHRDGPPRKQVLLEHKLESNEVWLKHENHEVEVVEFRLFPIVLQSAEGVDCKVHNPNNISPIQMD